MYVFIYINTHTYNSPTSFYSLSSIYIYICMEDARSVQVRKPEIPDPWPITGNVHPTYYIYVYVHTYYISIYTYIYIHIHII